MFSFFKKHSGFTIIQLVIAMVIFSILSSIAFYGGSTYVNQGRETDAINTLHEYEAALENAISYNKGKCVKGSEAVSASNLSYNSAHEPVYTSGASWLSDVFTIDIANNYFSEGCKIIKETTNGDFCGHSECVDEWGNAFRFFISYEDKEPGYYKECYITVVCLGKDGQIGTEDDIVLLDRYADGLIESQVVDKHPYTGAETYPMPTT